MLIERQLYDEKIPFLMYTTIVKVYYISLIEVTQLQSNIAE